MLLLLDAIILCLCFILHLVSHALMLAYCTLVSIVFATVTSFTEAASPLRANFFGRTLDLVSERTVLCACAAVVVLLIAGPTHIWIARVVVHACCSVADLGGGGGGMGGTLPLFLALHKNWKRCS